MLQVAVVQGYSWPGNGSQVLPMNTSWISWNKQNLRCMPVAQTHASSQTLPHYITQHTHTHTTLLSHTTQVLSSTPCHTARNGDPPLPEQSCHQQNLDDRKMTSLLFIIRQTCLLIPLVCGRLLSLCQLWILLWDNDIHSMLLHITKLHHFLLAYL